MGEGPPQGLRPSTVERTVTEIWKDVLNMPDQRKDATFFELGGQSISAVRITARVEDELGIEVDLDVLFDDPDLETFVRTVTAMAAHSSDPARRA